MTFLIMRIAANLFHLPPMKRVPAIRFNRDGHGAKSSRTARSHFYRSVVFIHRKVALRPPSKQTRCDRFFSPDALFLVSLSLSLFLSPSCFFLPSPFSLPFPFDFSRVSPDKINSSPLHSILVSTADRTMDKME